VLGGETAYSNGGQWIGTSALQRSAGLTDSAEEVWAYLQYLGAGY
jgi:3-oxosteroid 1-dehydrogenase